MGETSCVLRVAGREVLCYSNKRAADDDARWVRVCGRSVRTPYHSFIIAAHRASRTIDFENLKPV
jgi:hypothetical protein